MYGLLAKRVRHSCRQLGDAFTSSQYAKARAWHNTSPQLRTCNLSTLQCKYGKPSPYIAFQTSCVTDDSVHLGFHMDTIHPLAAVLVKIAH